MEIVDWVVTETSAEVVEASIVSESVCESVVEVSEKLLTDEDVVLHPAIQNKNSVAIMLTAQENDRRHLMVELSFAIVI